MAVGPLAAAPPAAARHDGVAERGQRPAELGRAGGRAQGPGGQAPGRGGGPSPADRRPPGPAVVVVLDGSYRLRQLPGMATVLADGAAVGVYALCRGDDRAELPRECIGRVIVDPAGNGRASYRDRERRIEITKLDSSTPSGPTGWPGRSRPSATAPVTSGPRCRLHPPAGSVGDGPADRRAGRDRWQRGGRTTEVPLGRLADGLFMLDIAREGPHMLVAAPPDRARASSCRPSSPRWRSATRRRRSTSCSSTTRAAPRSSPAGTCRTSAAT